MAEPEKVNPMDALPEDVVGEIRSRMGPEFREKRAEEVRRAGGPPAWLLRKFPGLSKLVAESTDLPRRLIYQPVSYLTEVESREQLCRRCKAPEAAPLCEGFPGEGTRLSAATAEMARCDAFTDRALCRGLEMAGVPPAYRRCRFSNFRPVSTTQRAALEMLRAYVKAPPSNTLRRGVMLCGPAGTGKTHLAVAALAELDGRNVRGKFANVPRLLSAVKAEFKRDRVSGSSVMEQIRSAPVLVLDDLGAEYHRVAAGEGQTAAGWSQDELYQLIDYRWGEALRTIVTTNLALPELKEILGPRIASRIAGMCEDVVVDGDDMRLGADVPRIRPENNDHLELVAGGPAG